MKKITKSISHAFRGIYVILRGQRNMKIHIFAVVVCVALGFWLKISNTEWLILLLLFGLVLTSEAFNSGLENTLDCVSKDHREDIRDAKDVAAGAVLIASIISLIAGIIIFLPKIFS